MVAVLGEVAVLLKPSELPVYEVDVFTLATATFIL